MSIYVTQGLRRAAALDPEKAAVIDQDGVVSWAQFEHRVAAFAHVLRGFGLKPGDRVAYLGHNSSHILAFYMAAPWADLIGVTLNTRWSLAEMTNALEDAGATFLIADAHFISEFPELAERCKGLICTGVGGHLQGTANLGALIGNATPMADCLRGDAETVGLYFTGGTTGRSKGVMMSSATLVPTALQVQMASEMDGTSVVLHSAPLFHMAAGGMAYAAFGAGASQVTIPYFEPCAVMEAIEQHGVTHVLWVPTMLQMLLDHPDFSRYDLSSLKRIIYGAAPMPEALLRRAIKHIPSAGFVQFYGMTELSPIATDLRPEDHDPEGPNRHRLRSAGRPSGGVELRIVDDQGKDVPRNATGEVVVRSPGVMQGYWGQPDLTAVSVRNGWMHTGDAGYLDDDGYLYVVDRVKDMIISGGENIFSAEVENAIYKLPGLVECAVVGLPDDKWGEIVCAYVRTESGADLSATDIIQHCKAQMSAYKAPKKVIFSDAPLPKTGAGKINKADIRKQLAAGVSV